MKNILLFASIAIIFASCSSSQPTFELEVNILNNASLLNKKFVINQNIDGAVVYADTLKIKKNSFKLDIPYHGPALINISITPQSNINNIMMAAEEGTIQLNIEGNKVHFGGTPLNDNLQAYYHANDSISLLFQELQKEYDLKIKDGQFTSDFNEEFRSKRIKLIRENTDRIIAFIKENVDNPVGEYFFMTNYINFTIERKLEMDGFATEKLKKEFGIQ